MAAAQLALEKLYDDLQVFFFNKDIVSFAASVTVGFATRDVITSLMNDVFWPVARWATQASGLASALAMSPAQAAANPMMAVALKRGARVMHAIVTWAVMLVMAFVILEYVVSRQVIGLKTRVKRSEADDFVKAKVEAQLDPVLPLDRHDAAIVEQGLIANRQEEERAKQDLEREYSSALAPHFAPQAAPHAAARPAPQSWVR